MLEHRKARAEAKLRRLKEMKELSMSRLAVVPVLDGKAVMPVTGKVVEAYFWIESELPASFRILHNSQDTAFITVTQSSGKVQTTFDVAEGDTIAVEPADRIKSLHLKVAYGG
ncbi:MAG: hypothetical protein KatS3mg015_2780 [Fimbriimonadales bacterium]|nr:MAG: hypothetical protein KatS3mg015_2780 [Fimbriimonadales bacterium]